MVQRGEQLRAWWVIPFPKENYFLGGTRAGERGLVCGKSFCAFTHPTSLGRQEECWVQEQRSQKKPCKPQLICKHPWLLMRIPT